MKQIYNHPYFLFMLLTIYISSIAACKKNSITDDAEKPESPVTGTRTELISDSIYLYVKHTYLWDEAIPDYSAFNPRNYTAAASEVLNFKRILFDLSQYKINPQTSRPYEKTNLPGLSKYSYLEDGNSGTGLKASLPEILVSAGITALVSENAGYIKLGEFGHLNQLKPLLDDAFNGFTSSDVNTLFIDLRGNPGGYVETAQYLADLIATPSMTGKVMYAEYFNEKMQQGKAGILKNQPYLDKNNKPVFINNRRATYADIDFSIAGNTHLFEKSGQLNTIKKIYFLVNGSTASASELLINALLPYFDIELVGSNTYGKPVGSFALNIFRHTLYAVSFQIKNAKGNGDYFDGMPVNIEASEEQMGLEPVESFMNVLALVNKSKQAHKLAVRSNIKTIISQSAAKSKSIAMEMIKDDLMLKQHRQTASSDPW